MLDTPDKLRAFYKDRYAKHGATPEGMAWRDKNTHYKRLYVANEVAGILSSSESRNESVLDVGCGIGLLPLLWGLQYHHTSYHGIDVIREYIDEAKATHVEYPQAVFLCQDFLSEYTGTIPFNVTVAIGVFAWQAPETVDMIIDKMWKLTAPNGVMLFSYLPGNPMATAQVNWLKRTLRAVEYIHYIGYAGDDHEAIAAFKK